MRSKLLFIMLLMSFLFIIFEVNISATSDTTPPTLENVEVNKDEVKAGEEVTIYVTAKDEQSGIDYVSIMAKSPSKEHVVTDNIWETDEQGRYAYTVTIDKHAEPGEWLVNTTLNDTADNSESYWTEIGFEVINTEDNTEENTETNKEDTQEKEQEERDTSSNSNDSHNREESKVDKKQNGSKELGDEEHEKNTSNKESEKQDSTNNNDKKDSQQEQSNGNVTEENVTGLKKDEDEEGNLQEDKRIVNEKSDEHMNKKKDYYDLNEIHNFIIQNPSTLVISSTMLLGMNGILFWVFFI
ncbi:DUF7743 domain-containing protein [Piscibacillus sp. B03]|uniref:DUF7743 domain-containing protein n=1 Tax=Piscibacillus sp. B03 TaxID=3457430 RepID=UPI003FCCA8AB